MPKRMLRVLQSSGRLLFAISEAAILRAARQYSNAMHLRPIVCVASEEPLNPECEAARRPASSRNRVMRLIAASRYMTLLACALSLGAATATFDLPQRTELKRVDLSGAPGMEVITSISELKTGEQLPRHLHHGVETAYVLQGSLVQVPGKEPVPMETGTSVMNLRDVPHGGFTVVGDTPLRLLTVHVVDKGRPLYEWAD
jgi:quercetin dioxygenase-like cupin family protein